MAVSRAFKGCLLAIFALVIVPTVCIMMMPDTPDRPSSTRPSSGTSAPRPSAGSQLTVTFDDGSKVTLTNVRNIQDGACGPRRMAMFTGPAGSMEVMVYLNRKGEVVSIRVPQAGNEAIYSTEGIECLMNWETNRMEYMTEAEYQRHAKAAGK